MGESSEVCRFCGSEKDVRLNKNNLWVCKKCRKKRRVL
jgi:ribosomal protein L37AE/L43A